MYWIRWDTLNYKIIVPKITPYLSRDFLKLDKESEIIDENNLKFKYDQQVDEAVSNFPGGNPPGVFVCSPETWSLFQGLDLGNYKVYEAKVEKEKMLFVCCMNEQYGFDYERSVYDRYEDGTISDIRKLVVVSKFVEKFDMFRLKDEWRCRFELIVSGRFRSVYEKNMMTGLIFKSVL